MQPSMDHETSETRRSPANFLTWLYPGMHVKRWLLLLGFGVALFGLGVGYFLREIYVSYVFPEPVYYATLQFLPRATRGVMFVFLAVGAISLGVWGLSRSLLSAYRGGRREPLVDVVYQHRYRQRGPKLVAIGGGTGLSVLLRGLKEHSANLTAVVTVADDGGSSGRLRRELGVLPPGDFRNCIAALAEAETLMTRLMQYRFSEGSGLEGHSFGNLFIVAMSGVVGNFEQAIRETSRVLAVRGQILPSTLENVTLMAHFVGEQPIRGESKIPESGKPIARVSLEPREAAAYPEAVQAILEADMIILGPGSLYTSVMPNLLVDGITQAIKASPAVKVYVCNVATQPGETDGHSVEDHAEAILRHVGPGVFQHILYHDPQLRWVPPDGSAQPVAFQGRDLEGIRAIGADVVNPDQPLRHDPGKLSKALLRLLKERQSQTTDPFLLGIGTGGGDATSVTSTR
ncbi:MAG: YvcK family protein [Dehalococcoidia bacterium]|nr:YvcK family protein [Dehalococcoidia bacterium]